MRKKKRNLFVRIITLEWLFMLPVLFYKKCISPLMPHVCGYYPSCSNYMLYAIKTRGVVVGVALGVARLFRCTPWAKGGFDPVPPKKGDYKWLY